MEVPRLIRLVLAAINVRNGMADAPQASPISRVLVTKFLRDTDALDRSLPVPAHCCDDPESHEVLSRAPAGCGNARGGA